MQVSAKKIYDPLTGRYIREIRSNDIVHIAAVNSQYSAGTIAFTALDSDTELFITGFGFTAQTASDFYVTIGTSTILPVYLAANGSLSRTTNLNAPLAKASASSTISICIGTAGTVSAWLSGVRMPKFSKIETV